MTIKYSPSNISRIEEDLQAQFDKAVSFFEKGDYSKSIENAQSVGANLSKALDRLVAEYQNVMDEKFSELKALQKALDQIKTNDVSKTPPDFVSLLAKLEKNLMLVKSEIRHNFPQRSTLGILFEKHKKILGVSVLVFFLGLSLGFFVWNIASAKRGLVGEYFGSKDMRNFHKRRIDPAIDFDWHTGSPFPNWKQDNFSVRWTGYLRVSNEGLYEFSTFSDDGVSLWINDKNVISNWTNHSETRNQGEITLKPGYYAFRLEYYDARWKAKIRLFWKKEGDSKARIISSKFFIPRIEYMKSDLPLIHD